MTVEAIFLPKDFYSPYSLSNPSRFNSWRKDEFYLNGGSMRYSPNMAGINFNFDNKSSLPTIYQEKPFNFNINMGLRFNLGK